jgi:O-acetyl-ADP-ribose deacetylase (regulator of RNase III)
VAAHLEARQVDITSLDVDAIVNAANSALAGGGGVDGAIHRAAGPQLLEACRAIGGCATGDAVITPGFKLRAHWVIHAVGPVWSGGQRGEDELLASCYQRAIELASQAGAKSLAFPAISTGVYRFPAERASAIAVRTVRGELANAPNIERIVFACFDALTLAHYQGLLA